MGVFTHLAIRMVLARPWFTFFFFGYPVLSAGAAVFSGFWFAYEALTPPGNFRARWRDRRGGGIAGPRPVLRFVNFRWRRANKNPTGHEHTGSLVGERAEI